MRRHTLLFLGAVIVPSTVLVALGIRTLRQEEELAERRRNEEKIRVVGLIRQELLTRLEGIGLRAASGQITPRDRSVALVARLNSGRLIMPWESPPPQREASREFARTILSAERQLHQLRDPKQAAVHARAAALKARTPVEQAQADLLLAASLSMAADHQSSLEAARRVLLVRPLAVDEYGVPYALYAAQRLRNDASPDDRRRILETVSHVLDTIWLSPAAADMVVALLATFQTGALHSFASSRAAELEQLEGIPSELPLLEKSSAPAWTLYGSSPWFLGLTGKRGDPDRVLIAVRAREALDAVNLPDGARWLLGTQAKGEPLGEPFPGLKLSGLSGPVPDGTSLRQLFYLSALVLVLSVTVLSAYLLNRDVRRERHLTALRSHFVSSVSHELRTPISTIRTCAELLDMGRVSDECQASAYVKTIVGESERLSRLVDGILDFSRIEQGERTFHFRPVSLAEVLQSAARQLEYQLAQGGFQLRIAVDFADARVRADYEAVERAIVNLLSNAMKYSGERRDIDLSLHRDGDRAVIRVHDYGIGIAAGERARIFGRFHRAPLPDGRVVPGAGLGLTIVDQIVKAHNGRVTVESQPRQGSTFSIFLPIHEDS